MYPPKAASVHRDVFLSFIMSAEVVKGSLQKVIANDFDGEATFVVRITKRLAAFWIQPSKQLMFASLNC